MRSRRRSSSCHATCRPGGKMDAETLCADLQADLQTDPVSRGLLHEMRLYLDQVREIDRVLGESARSRRTPDGDRIGSQEFREWRTARIRLKEEVLAQYREVRDRLNHHCPGFDIKQAVMSTKLLRQAGKLLAKLRDEIDDFDRDELELIQAIEDHVRGL